MGSASTAAVPAPDLDWLHRQRKLDPPPKKRIRPALGGTSNRAEALGSNHSTLTNAATLSMQCAFALAVSHCRCTGPSNGASQWLAPAQ